MRHPQRRKPVSIGLGGHGGAEAEAVRGKTCFPFLWYRSFDTIGLTGCLSTDAKMFATDTFAIIRRVFSGDNQVVYLSNTRK